MTKLKISVEKVKFTLTLPFICEDEAVKLECLACHFESIVGFHEVEQLQTPPKEKVMSLLFIVFTK